jgi:hypothetical protein
MLKPRVALRFQRLRIRTLFTMIHLGTRDKIHLLLLSVVHVIASTPKIALVDTTYQCPEWWERWVRNWEAKG